MQELKYTYEKHGQKLRLVCRWGYKVWNQEKNAYDRPPLRITTDLRWDSFPNREEMARNIEVRKIQSQISKGYENLVFADKEVTPQSLSSEIDRLADRKPNRNNTSIPIIPWISDYVSRNPDRVKKNTLKQYKTLLNFISGYELVSKRSNLRFEDFDLTLYNDLITYSQSKLQSQAGVWSKHKEFKRMLNAYSRETGIEVFSPTTALSSTQKRAIAYKTGGKLALNWDQVARILSKKDLSDELLNTRNAFLHLIFTGVRYSDLHALEHSISDDDFLYFDIQTQKTGAEVVIPVLKPLLDLRRDYGFPRILSNQKLNEQLKVLGEACGLDEFVSLSSYNTLGQKETNKTEVYKVISTHTGRRTFITNLIDYIPMTVLAGITGHSIKGMGDDLGVLIGYRETSKIKNAELFLQWLKKVESDNRDNFPIPLA